MSIQTTLPERTGVITFKGGPATLIGAELSPGTIAPDFTLAAAGLKPFTLDNALDGGKRAALLITLPSLDTPTCSIETLTFNKRLAELPANVATFAISADLPFAQARWAEANAASNIQYLSSYRDQDFAPTYGILVKEISLLARAIFLIAPDKKISYIQLVPEVGSEPNYDEVIAAAKKLA